MSQSELGSNPTHLAGVDRRILNRSGFPTEGGVCSCGIQHKGQEHDCFAASRAGCQYAVKGRCDKHTNGIAYTHPTFRKQRCIVASKQEIVDFIKKEIIGKDETMIEKTAERVVQRFHISYDIAVSMVWEVYASISE